MVAGSLKAVSYTHLDVYKRQVYIKELSAPAGYKVDKTVYPLTIKAGETAILKVSDTPKAVSYTHLQPISIQPKNQTDLDVLIKLDLIDSEDMEEVLSLIHI